MTVDLLQFEWLSVALVDSVSFHPLPLAHGQAAAKMINNDWQAQEVGLMDMREIARIIASNTVRIDLPMWLRLEPYCKWYSWFSNDGVMVDRDGASVCNVLVWLANGSKT